MGQLFLVDRDPGALHLCQDVHQRQLDVLEQRHLVSLLDVGAKLFDQREGAFDIATGVGCRFLDLDLVHRDLLAASTDQLADLGLLDAQPVE